MTDQERSELQATAAAVRSLKDRVNALMRGALDANSQRATKYAQAAKQLDAAYEQLSEARGMNGR